MSYNVELPPGFRRPRESDDEADKAEDVEQTEAKRVRVVGPALPPHLAVQSSRDDDDDYGPKPPSSVRGPEPPHRRENNADDDADDDLGPMPMPAAEGGEVAALYEEDGAAVVRERERLKFEREQRERELANAPREREEWMIELPVERRIDALSARTFSKSQAGPVGDRSGWTETPEAKRLSMIKAAQSGEDANKPAKKKDAPAPVVSDRDREIAEQVEKFNASKRDKSLMDLHRAKIEEEKRNAPATDPNAYRPWNRETDLVQRKMSSEQKQQVIEKSKDLANRFSSGSGQRFL